MTRPPRRLQRVRSRGDDGQLLLLVLVYTVVAGLLVTVVVDVSKVYLERRALVSAADGAALAAANEPDLAAVYRGAGAALPLSRAGATAAVRQYAADADLAASFPGFQVVGVDTDGVVVRVELAADVPLPFVTLLASRWSSGYPLHAVARARSPLVP